MSNNKKQIDLENLSVFKEEMDASIDEKISTKQDALEFNPEVPSGTTPTELTGIKNGDNYYALGGGSSSALHMYACYGLITINSQNISVRFTHLTDKDNLSTYKDVANDMYDKNMLTHNRVYSCCGDFSLGNGSIISLVGVSGTDGGGSNRDKLTVYYRTITIDFANQSIAQSSTLPDSILFNTSLAFLVTKIF